MQFADSAEGPWLVAGSALHELGRDTPMHSHARGQAFGAVAGLITVETETGRWVVPATHAVWVPPHQRHGVRVHGPFEGWSAYLAEAACEGLPRRPFAMRMSGLLREAILRACGWNGEALSAPQERIAQVVRDEIGALSREPAGRSEGELRSGAARRDASDPLGLPMPRDPRLARIAEGLAADPADRRSLDEWTAQVGMAPRSASRRFQAETGFGYADWRQRARALKALEWLAAGRPVTQVALSLGYDNVSAFIAMFKRQLGCTPGRYFASVEGDVGQI